VSATVLLSCTLLYAIIAGQSCSLILFPSPANGISQRFLLTWWTLCSRALELMRSF
jgi:hypothetical protein